MKILLLSDTHSHIDERMIHHIKMADEVWHAGDIGDLAVTDQIKKLKPLRAVYGNIDGTEARKEFPLNQLFVCEQVKVLMTHRSEEHTSELQSRPHLVCRLLLEKKKKKIYAMNVS